MTPTLHSSLSWPKCVGFVLMAVLAVGVSVVSARFLLPDPPLAEAMRPQLEARPIIFLTHVICGAIALMLGSVQFVTRLGRRRRWHAAAGRIYVLACLFGGGSGLVIAWFSFAGPVATAGFSSLAVAWLVTTLMGWREIVAGRIASHRRWMTRSYAVTLAAVTLRLMLPWPAVMGWDFVMAYQAISFLCWIPNLVAAEVWLALTGLRTPGVPQ